VTIVVIGGIVELLGGYELIEKNVV
jgi:hypothetical protein